MGAKALQAYMDACTWHLPGGNLPSHRCCSHGNALQVDDRLTLAQDIELRLKDFEQKADLYAARERIFSLPPSEYPTLTGENQASCADEHNIKLYAARTHSPAWPHETDSVRANL